MTVELFDQDAETVTGTAVELGPPVDPIERPTTYATVRPPSQLRPIVPAVFRSARGRRAFVRWSAMWVLHTVLYHVVRVPKYALRIAVWAPVGAGRILWKVGRWVADVDGRVAVRVQFADTARANPEGVRRLVEVHDRHVWHRLYGGVVVLVLTLAAGVAAWWLAPRWAVWAGLGLLVLILARVGRPQDRPIVDRVQVGTAYRKLTADLVRSALVATGHVKAAGDVTFPTEIARAGAGYLATVDLPHGVTAGMVADRRDRIAASLRLPLDQVWLRTGRHAGQVELYVSDAPVSATPHPRWPLARTGRVDVFAPVPVGTDERGDQVAVTLAYNNLVIGAVPRMGKTAALRLLLLAAALDPRTELWAADLKGTGDLSPLAPVCRRHFVGDDDDTMAALVSSLRELVDDMRRRTSVVRNLPRDLAPDSKVTGPLVDNPTLGLSPIVLAVDECQVLFTDDTHGAEAERLVTDLVKRGPAVGIIVVLATQRPDAKSLPTGITANASMRLCLRVMGQPENDAVLGTGAYRNGVRATQLPASAKGLGWLVGAADEPLVVRFHYVDGPAADRIVARAVQARGGPVAHQQQPVVRVDLVADVAAVWPAGETGVWSEDLVPRLAELRGDHYGRWDVPTLNAALRSAGVDVGQLHRKVDGRGITRAGVRRSAIDSARPAIDRSADSGADLRIVR